MIDPNVLTILKKQKIHLVIYTDGGCNPNPGFAAAAMHGYAFEERAAPKKPFAINNSFIVKPESSVRIDWATPTNIGYRSYENGKRTEAPVKEVIPLAYVEQSYSFFDPVTNNIAELYGVILAFETVKALLIEGVEVGLLQLKIDSQYTLKTLTAFGDAYRRNGWLKSDGTPPKNREEIEMMMELRDELRDKGVQIQAEWVRGHNGDVGNGMADYLATIGVRRSRANDNPNQVKWFPHKNYWDAPNDTHPFLTFRRGYFNRIKDQNTPGNYFMIEPASEDLMIGKRDHEAYAVIRLNTPNIYLEAIREAAGKFGQHENKIMVDRMERINQKIVQKFIREHGSFCLGPTQNMKSVAFLDSVPLAVEHSPPTLFYRVLEAFGVIDEKLSEFVSITGNPELKPNTENGDDSLIIHDVTSEFYTVEEKTMSKVGVVQKKTLNPKYVVGYKNHTLLVEEKRGGRDLKFTVPMALGMDLPARNALKQLEDHNPNVYLLTWKTAEVVIRYAFVIDCATGVGIWSNYFCDRLYLKAV